MCIPGTLMSQCTKPDPGENGVLKYSRSNMQRPKVVERRVIKTPQALATNRESRCDESANSTPGRRTIRLGGSQQIFLGHDYTKEAQSRNNAPNHRSTWRKTVTKRTTQDDKRRTETHQWRSIKALYKLRQVFFLV